MSKTNFDRYTLGPEKEKKVFASRYKLLLPSDAELKAELLRELKGIGPAAAFRFQLSEFQLFSVAHEPRSPRQHLVSSPVCAHAIS